MIKVCENTVFTKSIVFQLHNFSMILGIKTIKWIIYFFKRKCKLFRFNSYWKNIKLRNKGLFLQISRKAARFFIIEIAWIKKHEYSKRRVYTYFHKKRYLREKPTLIQKIKNEIKQVTGK